MVHAGNGAAKLVQLAILLRFARFSVALRGQELRQPSRQLMHGCLDATGNLKPACSRVTAGADGTVTKVARPSAAGLFDYVKRDVKTARDFYELEVGIYERLQSVPRPRGCEQFDLFPRLLSKDDESLSFVTNRFGAPLEVSSSCTRRLVAPCERLGKPAWAPQ